MRKNEAKWIEKRNRWQINVQQDGVRKTFTDSTPGTKGKIACERKADKWLETGQKLQSPRFKDIWQQYLDYIKPDATGKSANGTGTGNWMQHESIGRNWLLPYLGAKRLDKITKLDLQQCVNRAYKAGRAKKTCQNIKASISALYNFALDQNIAVATSARKIKIPKDAPKHTRNILQPEQVKILFTHDQVPKRDTHGRETLTTCFYIHAFRFIFLTGLRRGEAFGLKWSDINDKRLEVKRSINKLQEQTGGKTENAQRSMILPAAALNELDEQRALLNDLGISSQYVFPTPDGLRSNPNTVYKHWVCYREHYGITSSIHELRHSMISYAKADVPEELLKEIVGHSGSMDTFGVYGHEVDGEKERTATMLDRIFDPYIH
jgi:integrase